MGIISWFIFGGIAGWVASLIAGTNARQGCLLNVIIGVVGAMIGGAIMEFFTGGDFAFRAFSLSSFIVAVVGSLILLAIVNAAQKRK